jgi:mono/diheme cytochrome c family protein
MRKIITWAVAGLFLGLVLAGAPGTARAADEQGKKLYTDKCLPCHGEKGDGKGPMGVLYNPPPASFIDAKFWQGDVYKKFTDAITNGKGAMIPVNLNPEEIKAVTGYLKKTFKK